MATHDDDPDYEIGYGKPPKATRFKKGQSGNPKGRPKGAKGLAASLRRELEAKITVREGGRTVTMSKAEATVKRLVELALRGDSKALAMLMRFDAQLGDATDAPDLEATAGKPDDVDFAILRDHFRAEAAEPPAPVPDTEVDDERA